MGLLGAIDAGSFRAFSSFSACTGRVAKLVKAQSTRGKTVRRLMYSVSLTTGVSTVGDASSKPAAVAYLGVGRASAEGHMGGSITMYISFRRFLARTCTDKWAAQPLRSRTQRNVIMVHQFRAPAFPEWANQQRGSTRP